MSFSCDDAEPVDRYVERIRKARKPWACSACGASIRVGDFHAYVAFIFEGKWEEYRRCGRCEATYSHLASLDPTNMQPMHDLSCGLRYEDEWGGKPPPEIQALPFLTADEASALLAARAKGGG